MYDSYLIQFLILFQLAPISLMLGVIVRRRLYRQIPWFTIYLAEAVVSAIVAYAAYHWHYSWFYFIWVWVDTGVAALLGFMATLDIVRYLFASYRSIRKVILTGFIAIAAILIVAAVVLAPFAASFPSATVRSLLEIDRSVRLVQLGLIVGLFALSSYLGLNWKSYQIGVPLGFGFEAACKLALTAYALQASAKEAYLIMLLDGAITMGTFLIWTVYFSRPDPALVWKMRNRASDDLERWNQALSEYMAI